MSLLASLLFPEYRRRVLGLLLLHPEARYHVREIARLTGTSAGTVHRELSKLAKAQVLTRDLIGNQVFYRANLSGLIYDELASILRKTSGLVDVLANALAPLADDIDVAFVFGSLASGKETEGSDVDVMIIGTLSFAEAVSALYATQSVVRREINPKVYPMAEWKKLAENNDPFITAVLSKPKLFIIGDTNDIQ